MPSLILEPFIEGILFFQSVQIGEGLLRVKEKHFVTTITRNSQIYKEMKEFNVSLIKVPMLAFIQLSSVSSPITGLFPFPFRRTVRISEDAAWIKSIPLNSCSHCAGYFFFIGST